MTEQCWKIGELATATGLTVRTLRHFHQIGLLRPAGRSSAGHRLYTGDDVRRLYRILALRELNMPLGEIANHVDGDGADLPAAIERQLAQAERQIELHRRLHRQLQGLARALRAAREPSIDQLIRAMEAMMQAKHLSPEHFAGLRRRHLEVGEAGFARWRDRMAELAARAAEHAERGTDPADPEVQDLAGEWFAAVTEMTGDDRSVLSALYSKIDRQGAEAATKGLLTTAAWEYLKRAFSVGFGGSG
ncbi:MerR family transcriptional regulator [Nonomuraea sp. MTCD27]|uniref:MerR family transcriptional regulator n=1 Tax=Nonomuraea sp. MTCD27 TaxID=1676747 RepID=UPI0035BFB076